MDNTLEFLSDSVYNVTVLPGVGKTYLACAFGNLACRLGFTVRYFRVSRLLNELTAAHGDGSFF